MQVEPPTEPTDATASADPEQAEINAVVKRLSRRQASGCEVIEHAAIMAEGTRSSAILAWITSHAWEPEERTVTSRRGRGGLHSGHRSEDDRSESRPPDRYVRWPAA